MHHTQLGSSAIYFGFAFNALVDDHSKWSQSTFGTDAERGPLGALKHLEKEAVECQTAETPDELRKELADCLLLLLDASRRAGLTPIDLVAAAHWKMCENRSRKWSKPVDGKPCEHVREE